jgi:ABC-type Fe3+/spermidine/putrescine transport system ATPase subunit
VGVIHNGHIIQEGSPEEVFRKPVNKFVARYAGIRNFFRVKFVEEDGTWKARCDGNLAFNILPGSYPSEGLLIVRSDAVKIQCSEPAGDHKNCFKGIIKEIVPSEFGMELMIDAGEKFYVDISANDFKMLKLNELSDVWITFPPEAGIALQGNL